MATGEREADRDMGLWRNADFLKLWAAQSVSSLGARITREGLPFAAVMSLGATPGQVGVLAALSRGPAILVGLTAGGFVDRRRRRPIMVGADIGRALILATLPLAAWSHRLTLGQLYGVAALVGALSVLFEIADHAYLPSLIAQDQLVDGNAKLAATDAVAEIGGPALYGVLFQFLTAPFAIAVNAGTYLFSALALGLIRKGETPPAPEPGETPHFITDFGAGLSVTRRHPSLWPLLLMATGAALFGSFFSALYIVYAARTLGLTATMLGTTVAVGGVSALLGAAVAPRWIRLQGIGPAFVITSLIAAAGSVFIPIAGGGAVLGMASLMVSQFIGDSVGTVAEIAGRGLRQNLVEGAMMGRVGGVFAVAPGITGIVGALLGGWLGQTLGMRPTLFMACGGVTLAAAIGLFSPLMKTRI